MNTAPIKKIATALFVLALAACSSTVPLNDKPVETKTGKAPSAVSSDPRTVPTITPDANRDALNDPQGVLAKRSVYFDYDSYDVKSEYKDLVQNHARYLVEKKISQNHDSRQHR